MAHVMDNRCHATKRRDDWTSADVAPHGRKSRACSKGEARMVDVVACHAHLRRRQQHHQQAQERRRQAALQAVCAAAQAVLPRFPAIHRAYLFGSVLRPGALRATSDMDVAVAGKLSAADYFALWRALEQAVGRWPIDLVELDGAGPFAHRIRAEGMVIYECPDPHAES